VIEGNPFRTHRHPVNVAIYDQASPGQQIADRVVAFVGSWQAQAVEQPISLLEGKILTALREEPKY